MSADGNAVTSKPSLAPDRASYAAIAGIIATVSIFAISQGLSYPLLSFILHKQGVAPAMIGASAAMQPLGYVVSALMVPWLARRFDAGRLTVACALLAAAMLALIGLVRDPVAWFPLRFLLGFFANPLYVISETWMLTITPAAIRGRVMGIYASVVSAGFAIGPLVLAIVGTEGPAPFVVGVCAFGLCALTLLFALGRLPPFERESESGSVLGFVMLAPLLIFAVVVTAGAEQALMSLISVYGHGMGSPEQRVATFLTVFIAGNIALQVPIGMLGDRIGAAAAMFLCAVLSVAGCALLPLVFGSGLLWPVAFIWGAAAFGVYTTALMQLGTRFSGALLMAGNAAFSLAWGLGGIIVPPLAGTAIDLAGIQGLPLAIGILSAILAAAVVLAGRGRHIAP
jgi:MFS family permease